MTTIKKEPRTKEPRTKTITLQDIQIKCDKCRLLYSANETCPRCTELKDINEEQYDQIIYDVPDHLKTLTKIQDIILKHDIYRKNICVEIYKDHVKFIGTRKKYKKIIDDDIIINFNDDDCNNKLDECLTHLEEYREIITEGNYLFNLSPNKFIWSNRYRENYYDFELNRFTAQKSNWKRIMIMMTMMGLGFVSDIVQREIREYFN